jgi:thiamine-phosphate pyrophosphorylase
MQHLFSPAAERVLLYAAGCTSPADYADLTAPALLLGLLAESECRAALMLAEHGITMQSVHQQWPKLLDYQPDSGIKTVQQVFFTSELDCSLKNVAQSAAEYITPPTLETEHLLLSLLNIDNEVSQWLGKRGVRFENVDADIRRRHGYREGPLPIEPESVVDTEDRLVVEELQIDNCKLQIANCRTGGENQKTEEPYAVRHTQSTLHPTAYSLQPTASFRILDAAANRAREGLRVVEDFVRFVLDDRHLTGECKQLRHDLTALLDQIPGEQLLAARETQADVGTTLSAPSEEHRGDMTDVLAANFARLQESLRSLEEFGKLISPAWAAEIKQIRYRSYTLHRAVEITRGSLKRLADARLYVLIDGRATLDEFRRLTLALIDTGVNVLQLRDKNLDDRELLERARLLRELIRGTNTLFIMNDRPDLAAICRADGVHMGQEDLSVKDARAIIGSDALIGVSTHTIEQARQAVLDGANYIGVGPTFPSGTKHFENYPGLELLRAVAAEIRLPAFAIGGITPENISQVLETGIARVAISGAIFDSSKPAAVVRELLNISLVGAAVKLPPQQQQSEP